MKNFASGIWFNSPRDKAPAFVVGNISIAPESFLNWLKQQKPNAKGYISLDILLSKEGKPYIALNEYQKENGK
jgi:hypothetical protein